MSAQLAVKSDGSNSDASAIVLKTISPVGTSGRQSTDAGASWRVAVVQFEIAPIDTATHLSKLSDLLELALDTRALDFIPGLWAVSRLTLFSTSFLLALTLTMAD